MYFQPWKDYLNLKDILFTSTEQLRCFTKINLNETKNENCIRAKQIPKLVIRNMESNKGEENKNKTIMKFLPKLDFNEKSTHEKFIKAEQILKCVIKDKEFNNRKEKENNPNIIFPCTFCRKNGEQKCIYLSHSLKNEKGLVTCPILQKYVCPKCQATGPYAHTLLYCPQNENYESPAVVHLTPKMSSGLKRRNFKHS